MSRLLIVEDQPNDLRNAAEVARSLGFTSVEARASSMAARVLLDAGLLGETSLPDAIILDLDLGYESGYELLRFWHSTPQLSKIPLIVWTVAGDEQREICGLFKVNAYVSKMDDISQLRNVLSGFAAAAS
jgi:CheY-like chemotaxis protein